MGVLALLHSEKVGRTTSNAKQPVLKEIPSSMSVCDAEQAEALELGLDRVLGRPAETSLCPVPH